MAPHCPWAMSSILVPTGPAETQCDVSCSLPASLLPSALHCWGSPVCSSCCPDGHSALRRQSRPPSRCYPWLCLVPRSPPDHAPPQQAGPGLGWEPLLPPAGDTATTAPIRLNSQRPKALAGQLCLCPQWSGCRRIKCVSEQEQRDRRRGGRALGLRAPTPSHPSHLH